MNALDTNILLYACDRSDQRKNAIAKNVVQREQGGMLPWQVAVEFIAATRRLEHQGFTPAMAWSRLRGFAQAYQLVTPTRETLNRAQHLHVDQQWSYWDALIVAACLEAGVTCLYSEDLPGQSPPKGLEITNLFA